MGATTVVDTVVDPRKDLPWTFPAASSNSACNWPGPHMQWPTSSMKSSTWASKSLFGESSFWVQLFKKSMAHWIYNSMGWFWLVEDKELQKPGVSPSNTWVSYQCCRRQTSGESGREQVTQHTYTHTEMAHKASLAINFYAFQAFVYVQRCATCSP